MTAKKDQQTTTILNRFTGFTLLVVDGADLHGADLHGADLRWADLRWADLRGADLHGASLHGTRWPSPTSVLLASWGTVSDELTRDLMVLDGWCHPDPGAFDRWADGGPYPYDEFDVQRAANFTERADLWPRGEKIPQSPLVLMRRLLEECCNLSSESDK